jgi:diguanylate cyclase (GGDEF)-like protein
MSEILIEGRRWIARALLLVAVLGASALFAKPPAETCYALAQPGAATAPASSAMDCSKVPTGYQEKGLWLRLAIPEDGSESGGSLVVNTTRFDRLSTVFEYPDGLGETRKVSRGAYGNHWRIGGQIAFPSRADATAVWLGFENLEDYNLLRIRFVPGEAAARQFELSALAIGIALGLLGIAALYNLSLAVALRRRFFLWHGCWAAAVLLWGVVWSQVALLVVPSAAGTLSSRIATILACFAIMFAAFSAAYALRSALSATARRAIVGLGILVAVLGLGASMPGANLTVFGMLLAIGTLATLAVVATFIGAAWRRGHVEGRDLAISWALPMAILAITQVIDLDAVFWGGGAQITMLFGSAFQAVCLSALATARLSALRVQRDSAVAASNTLAELADRDPLTGLLNRRGFVARCGRAFGNRQTTPFGLFLIDVDRFKAVNDELGHEAGDEVLVALGEKLRSFEQRHECFAGRLGGEEFVLGVSGLERDALSRLAESVREELANCDHGAVALRNRVTVSIGVAEGMADGPFPDLYGEADRALYAAKQAGRDRVMSASGDDTVQSAPGTG